MFSCQVLVNVYSKKCSYVDSTCIFLILMGTFPLDWVLVNTMKFVLFKFNDNLLILNQSLTLFNSLLTSVHSSFKLYFEHIMVLSCANKIHFNMVDVFHESLMYILNMYIYILNSFVPMIEHCGIPHLIVLCSELMSFICANCFLLLRYLTVHSKTTPPIA